MARSKIPIPVSTQRPRKKVVSVGVQTSFTNEAFKKGREHDKNILKPPTFASTPSSGLKNLRISQTQPSNMESIEYGRDAPSETRNNQIALSRISYDSTNSKSKLLKTKSYLANTQNQNLSNIIDNGDEHSSLAQRSDHEPSKVEFRLSSSESDGEPPESGQKINETNDDISTPSQLLPNTQLDKHSNRSAIRSSNHSTPIKSKTRRSLFFSPQAYQKSKSEEEDEIEPSQAKQPRISKIVLTKLNKNKPIDFQNHNYNYDFEMNEPTTSANANRDEYMDRFVIRSDVDSTPSHSFNNEITFLRRLDSNQSNSLSTSTQSSDSSVSSYVPSRIRFNLYDYDRLVSQIKTRKNIINDYDHEIDELKHPKQQEGRRRSDRLRLKRIKKLKQSKKYVMKIIKIEKLPLRNGDFNVNSKFITLRRGNEGFGQQQREIKKSRKVRNVVSPIDEE